jgi:predicted TIM-barrel fold metal-dependent hydrolase
MIDGMPVLDGIIHAYNLDPDNYANAHAGIVAELIVGMVGAMARPEYVASRERYIRDWSIEDTARMVFLESDTDLAVYHSLPLNAYKDGMCSFDKAVEAKRRWPDRIISYCGVDPLQGARALDELERQVEQLRPIGLKLYPNSWVGSEVRGWHMDDPEVAFPLFERARSLGIKVVAIHKAVPLGPVPMEHYRVDDIDRALTAFPDLQFEIVHGGMAFLEETAWQLGRYPNVWVNLEVTSAYVATRPAAFGHALATMASIGGSDVFERIIWGTGAVAFHPQPLLESFVRDFAFDETTMARTGIGQISSGDKQRILFENYGRMTGIDLATRLAQVADDEFAVAKRDGLAAPFSTCGGKS